jgi:chromosome segregation and condensation protein ScpB
MHLRTDCEFPLAMRSLSSQTENQAIASRALVRKARREERRLRSIISSEHSHAAERAKALTELRKFLDKRALFLADINEGYYAISPAASRQALARLIGTPERR